jgi:hypothetical protein
MAFALKKINAAYVVSNDTESQMLSLAEYLQAACLIKTNVHNTQILKCSFSPLTFQVQVTLPQVTFHNPTLTEQQSMSM